MKKSYLMIAAAATLFAACASDDSFKEIEKQERAIGFMPYTGNVTKSAITGSTNEARLASLADAGGFQVYGYKTTETTNLWTQAASISTIFYETDVTSSDNGATWSYTGLRFWDKNATYNFYAVAPANPGTSTYGIIAPPNANYGKITISNVASAKSGDSKDFLIDRNGATGQLGSNHTGSNNPTVDLEFHHIMAKVEFALKSTLTEGKITVTDLKMSGWNSGIGTFVQDQTITDTPSGLVHGEWDIETAGNDVLTLVGSGAGDNSVVLNCNPSATATPITDWYIMVPQGIDANTLKFTVSYTYNQIDDKGTESTDDDEITYTETFTNQEATVSNQHTWGTDSYTKYTLDINPNAIIFDVTSVCGFDIAGAAPIIDVK